MAQAFASPGHEGNVRQEVAIRENHAETVRRSRDVARAVRRDAALGRASRQAGELPVCVGDPVRQACRDGNICVQSGSAEDPVGNDPRDRPAMRRLPLLA